MEIKVMEAEVLDGFKMTEFGILPEEWEVVKLGEYCYKPQYGFTVSATDKPIGPKLLRITDIQNKGVEWKNVPYCECDIEKKMKYLLEKRDILIARIGATTGKAFLILRDFPEAIFASYLIRIRTKSNLLPEFLGLYCQTEDYWKQIDQNKGGRLKGGVNIPILQNLEIPLPPLPEQQRIAAVLSAVQEAKEKTEEVIKAARELKKSLMHHLFTYGAVPVGDVGDVVLKETEIGAVPEEWEVVRLEDVIEKTTQMNPKRYPEREIKYIDVSSISNDLFSITKFKEYLCKNAPSRARKKVKANDIIFATVRPYLKRIAIVTEKYDNEVVSTAFCVIRCQKNISEFKYLFYYILTDSFIERISGLQSGSSYPAVTDKAVKNQKIPLPPLPEQQRIAEILSTIDKKIQTEENNKNAQNSLFKTLLDNLMTAKIRVNNLNIKS